MTTVWIYDHGETLKVFDTAEAASAWVKKHDPEGVAFEYDVEQLRPAGTAGQYSVPRATE